MEKSLPRLQGSDGPPSEKKPRWTRAASQQTHRATGGTNLQTIVTVHHWHGMQMKTKPPTTAPQWLW